MAALSSRVFLYCAACVLAYVVSSDQTAAQSHGVDSAEEIGPYLNGVFPSKAPGSTLRWNVVDAFPNLTFVEPLALVPAPGTNQLLLVTCEGRFYLFDDDPATSTKFEILNISNQVDDSSKDTGFYCIAFHPRFTDPSGSFRYLYAYYRYTHIPGGSGGAAYMRLSRFTVPLSTWTIDRSSETVLVQQYDRHFWHSGGGLLFDDDGFLYVTVGDEGDAYDSYGSMRGLSNGLFGGVLRLDVDQDPSRSHPIRRQPRGAQPPQGWPQTFTANYFVPNDNPWLDPAGGILEEFYCYGLRSPHRMTYDSLSDEIWVGDVGQGSREEIDRIVRGGNYQWPYREGDLDTDVDSGTENIGTQQPPFWTYGRNLGSCVIGGLIYRGPEFAQDLWGRYLCSDHISSRLWALDPEVPGEAVLIGEVPSDGHGANIVSFAVNHNQDLLMLKWNGLHADGGQILKLAQAEAVPDPPSSLSALGAFVDLGTMTPREGLHPYGVQSPLYSDTAIKTRWIAVPNDGDHDSPGERIDFSSDSSWAFPEGTVFVKHFEMPMSEFDPSIRRKLETRFLVMGEGGKTYGLTYRWNAAGTNAFLIDDREDLNYSVETESGNQDYVWTFPSRSDCRVCHNDNAGKVLGVRTHQLNGDFDYPESGVTDNQLRALNHIGLFDPPISENEIGAFLKSYPLDDPTASLTDRVRSYVDVNCALCHQPGGNVTAIFDARYTTPLLAQDLVHGQIVGDSNPPGSRVVKAQDVANSMVHLRLSLLGDQQMPPIGRNRVDTAASSVIADWIQQLTPVPVGGPYRYVRLIADSEVNGQPWASMAELSLVDSNGDLIPKGAWSLLYVDSEERDQTQRLGSHAFDGNANTFWHTQWSTADPEHPHQIAIDLGNRYEISAFRYLPRQDGNPNGRVKAYRFFVSDDGLSWGDPVAEGCLPDVSTETEIPIDTTDPGQRVELRSAIASSEDDAEERLITGAVYRRGDDLEMGRDGNLEQLVGVRYSLNLPQAATIRSAQIQFTVEGADTSNALFEIYASAEDDAEPIRWQTMNLSSRFATDARVLWAPPPWPFIGERTALQQTPDLSEIVQEIVNRPGWDSGNSILFLIFGEGERTAESYDNSPALSAELTVVYDSANFPPIVDAGPDQRLFEGEVALLDGIATDEDSSSLSTLWEQVSGPGVVSFGDPTLLQTTAGFSVLGDYVLRLTAHDGALQDSDEMNVTVSANNYQDIEVAIASAHDDAEQRLSDGAVFRNSSDLELVDDGSTPQRFVGLRFLLPIPQGAEIASASIQFTADETDGGSASLVIRGEDSDNATRFLYQAFNLSVRPRTSASVPWSPPSWDSIGDAGPAQESPDIASIIQEIVNRPGFNAGNGVVILIDGSGERTAESFNGSSAKAPRLRVRWR